MNTHSNQFKLRTMWKFIGIIPIVINFALENEET
jgi:hypothetical protein